MPSKSGLLTTGYALEKGNSFYALEGSIAITGAAVQWLRDNLKMIKDANETEEIAQSVEDSGGAIFVPAYRACSPPTGTSTPRGDRRPDQYVNRAHLVQATLESECYQSRDVVEAVEQDSGKRLEDLRVDSALGQEQLPHAAPGRRPRHPGDPAPGPGDDRPGRGLPGRAGHRLLVLAGRDARELAGVAVRAAVERSQRESGYALWKKAIERTRGWVD